MTAVVVIWGEFPQEVFEGDRVTFIRGERLADWLREQPPRLDERRVQELAEALAELARSR